MPFEETVQQLEIRAAIQKVMAGFDDDYWLESDQTGQFPHDFRKAIAAGGWLGICMPEDVGGSALGISDAAVMMEAVANSAGAQTAASAIHLNIFGPHVLVKYGTDEQRQTFLPPIISGDLMTSFGVTEPDAGLDTTQIRTFARRDGDDYVISGRKIWNTMAQQAGRVLLLTRTSEATTGGKRAAGMTLFFCELDRTKIEVREIPKMGRHAVNSNMLFFDDYRVPARDVVGEVGRGFYQLLDGLNPERILLAAETVGIGRQALSRATQYAKDRVVFGRPIGQNQSIQHPLAHSWMELEAAWFAMQRAAGLYDAGRPCGAEANMAKYLGAEAGFKACERAVLTHGGMGYAQEYHVERLFREVQIGRLAPISQQLISCFIAERVLGLPKSY
ncbi:MAG TPA: acyl-CoA dehydrogenase family protein [Hyphomicrobiaceae bacterium]|nr:acyl-CoA dehydrogenase family protein [Hyphomicrobiaceae bacterium]